MVFVFGPSWFYGFDALIDIIILLITLFIAIYSFRIYLLAHDRRYLYFTLAFFFISLSYSIRAVTDWLVYTSLLGRIPNVMEAVSKVATVSTLHTLGFLAYVFLMLAGFMILVAIFLRINNVKIVSLLFIFVILLTALSQSVVIAFHLTLLVMLLYIVAHLFINFREHRSINSFLVLYSMATLLTAQALFVVFTFYRPCFVVGQILQLAGFLFLLVNMILVLKR